MEKKVIHTDKAPKAIGPYVQATVINGMVYTSGQLGLNPATTTLVEGGVQAEAKQALENLKAVLTESGSGMDKVVKTLVLLADINDFVAVNEVYATYFPTNPPSRSAFAVKDLPKGAKVEIEVVAYI